MHLFCFETTKLTGSLARQKRKRDLKYFRDYQGMECCLHGSRLLECKVRV